MDDREMLCRTMLRNVLDPELGVNIIDLGLVYDISIADNNIFVLMTFTTPGCPVGPMIHNSVIEALQPLGFDDIKVEITFDPLWGPEKMTAEGARLLGYGR